MESNSKDIYGKITYQNDIENKAMLKYSSMYNILQEVWKTIYSIYRSCTKDNKIKELQYKILHRYIPTNKLLFQMGKITTNKCTFCEIYTETIEHLFFECHFVRNIWFELEHRLHLVEDVKICLTASDVLLCYNMYGNQSSNLQTVNINTVLLYVKNYIWECKIVNVKPTNRDLLQYLSNHTMYVPYLRNIVM